MPIGPAQHRPAQHKAVTHESTAEPPSTKYRAWYTHSRWRKVRAKQLAAYPLCQFCRDKGKVTEANVCDHAYPHKGDINLFYAGPFISLCKLCHDSTKKRMENRGQSAQAPPRTYTMA